MSPAVHAAVVLHQHPAVADCAVFGVPDDERGESVIAAVERCGEVEPAELIAFVGAQLSTYKQPSSIHFVTKIPRIASGKVLRRVLKDAYGTSSDERQSLHNFGVSDDG